MPPKPKRIIVEVSLPSGHVTVLKNPNEKPTKPEEKPTSESNKSKGKKKIKVAQPPRAKRLKKPKPPPDTFPVNETRPLFPGSKKSKAKKKNDDPPKPPPPPPPAPAKQSQPKTKSGRKKTVKKATMEDAVKEILADVSKEERKELVNDAPSAGSGSGVKPAKEPKQRKSRAKPKPKEKPLPRIVIDDD